MRAVHRLVVVIGLFGGLLMFGLQRGSGNDPQFWPTLFPLILAAGVIYPIAWVIRGFR